MGLFVAGSFIELETLSALAERGEQSREELREDVNRRLLNEVDVLQGLHRFHLSQMLREWMVEVGRREFAAIIQRLLDTGDIEEVTCECPEDDERVGEAIYRLSERGRTRVSEEGPLALEDAAEHQHPGWTF